MSEWFADANKNGIIDLQDSGDLVAHIQIRLRELGYFHFKATGLFQGVTQRALLEFQKFQTDAAGKAIIADGSAGEQTLEIIFSTRAVRGPILEELRIGPRADGTQTESGQMTDWFVVKNLLNENTAYTLTDYNTGVRLQMVYTGGEQHAEMECGTPEDTAAFKSLFGGKFNYSKRPMLLSLNGDLIACSLQGEPHGADAVPGNDMTGHACLFFKDSKSHVGMLADVEHIDNIYKAAN
ncbi:MAG: peptidoglycan-binding protein [Clostridiales bacterium]|nr:peptidoglycan-binding protein [Clostridiales bacterium]